MEITNIIVKSWKHFSFNKELILKPGVNLILGKNGSGKTSLLKMIQDASLSTNQGLDPENSGKAEGTNFVTINVKDNSDAISIMNNKSGSSGNWMSNALNGKIRYISSQRTITSGNKAKNPLVHNLGDISVSVPDQSIDVAEEFNKAIIKELIDKISTIPDSINFLSELEEGYQNELIDFDKILKIDPKRENAVYFIDYKSKEVAVNDLSSGEKEYIYFYAFLRRIKSDEGNIILIDEPELHLHSSQIRKLCELISVISLKNQVIIATHSGEVLQYFINCSNIVLLSKGVVNCVSSPDMMQRVLEETGLPIDPSVFTAHWICAENEPTKQLSGGGANTPEVLEWIFGKDLKKRYWSFGSNRAIANAYGEGMAITGSTGLNINVTAVIDGDKLIKKPDDYLTIKTPEPERNIAYFPFWELENIFLVKSILNNVIVEKKGKDGLTQFWELIETNRVLLINSIKKSIVRNNLRKYNLDFYIGANPVTEIEKWKSEVAAIDVDLSCIDDKFNTVITEKKWEWLPGKEALGLLVGNISPDFWVKLRILHQDNKLCGLLQSEIELAGFIKKVNNLI